MTTIATDRRTAQQRFRLIGLILPILAGILLALAQLALLPWLPDPVATHWGIDGTADGFGPGWMMPLITLGVTVGVPALLGGTALAGFERPGQQRRFRFPAAMSWWVIGFIGGLSTASLALQVGLTDAQDAPNLLPVLGASAGIGVLLGVLAWRLTTDPPADEAEEGIASDPMRLAGGEQAVWLQTVTMSRVAMIVLGIALAVTVASVVWAAAVEIAETGRIAGTWIGAGVLILVVVAVATCVVFRVRVDESGLLVRAATGWPRIRIPLAEIAGAEVVSVDPMGEYGGWGWRYGIGSGWGVILRAGEAVRVTRHNGKVFTVTVDDAETAVALLRGLQERTQG